MKKNNLEKLITKTNKDVDKFNKLFRKISDKNISEEEFEKLKEEIYKLGNRTNSDAKFLNLLEKSREIIN